MRRDDSSPAAYRRDVPAPQRTLLALVLFGLACAPSDHTASTVRDDPHARAHVQARAAAECKASLASLPGPPPFPTQSFRTDGCSLWFDAFVTGESWQRCCINHDIAYWCGGSEEMREAADDALRDCVADDYRPWMGAIMRPGVWLGGAPWVPAWFRWGYGHRYPVGYFDAAK